MKGHAAVGEDCAAESRLQLGEVTSPYLEGQAGDTVLVQAPRPGVQAANPHVDVLAPQGPRAAAFVMPFFIGLNESGCATRADFGRRCTGSR